MYKKTAPSNTMLNISVKTEGETIEQRVSRIMNNGEPITDGAPPIYTERKDGVIPEYNVRTDRWDLALDAQEKIVKQKLDERDKRQKEREEKNNPKETPADQGTPPAEPVV